LYVETLSAYWANTVGASNPLAHTYHEWGDAVQMVRPFVIRWAHHLHCVALIQSVLLVLDHQSIELHHSCPSH
jgi:hypothetical protein